MYESCDDDLPDIFYKEVSPAKVKLGDDKELLAQLIYPVIHLTRSQRASLNQDKRESAEGIVDKKSYIKIGKKLQMYDWLCSMESNQLFGAMDDFERRFCEEKLLKFRKYTVQGAKWLTIKQYNFT